jgi:hypothetical protein
VVFFIDKLERNGRTQSGTILVCLERGKETLQVKNT